MFSSSNEAAHLHEPGYLQRPGLSGERLNEIVAFAYLHSLIFKKNKSQKKCEADCICSQRQQLTLMEVKDLSNYSSLEAVEVLYRTIIMLGPARKKNDHKNKNEK